MRQSTWKGKNQTNICYVIRIEGCLTSDHKTNVQRLVVVIRHMPYSFGSRKVSGKDVVHVEINEGY